MRRFAAVSILVLSTLPAAAGFATYSQWQAMPADAQAAYVAGAFDSVVTIVDTDTAARTAQFRLKCMVDQHMTTPQLARNILAYAASRPELQRAVQGALIAYLIALCGEPPTQ
jgi:hypothetical protein